MRKSTYRIMKIKGKVYLRKTIYLNKGSKRFIFRRI